MDFTKPVLASKSNKENVGGIQRSRTLGAGLSKFFYQRRPKGTSTTEYPQHSSHSVSAVAASSRRSDLPRNSISHKRVKSTSQNATSQEPKQKRQFGNEISNFMNGPKEKGHRRSKDDHDMPKERPLGKAPMETRASFVAPGVKEGDSDEGARGVTSATSSSVSASQSAVIEPKKVQKDLTAEESKNASKGAQGPLRECDQKDVHDVQRLPQYADDIFRHLMRTEKRHLPKSDYLKTQTSINGGMRAILVDWLNQVHLHFKLLPETFYITVALLDRYLSVQTVNKSQLQLLGVSCLLIAAKYEEIYPPEGEDLVYITDRAYKKPEILAMERKVLAALKYEITFPTAYRFLERMSKVAGSDQKMFFFAQFMMELALVEDKMIGTKPSKLAACALYLSHKRYNRAEVWSSDMEEYTSYKADDLRESSKDMCQTLKGKADLQAARKKFSTRKFLEVAKMESSS